MIFGLGFLFPGDGGIAQTVNALRSAIHFSLRRPEVRARAEGIVASVFERDEVGEVRAVFEWVKAHYRYLRDINGVETIKSPEVIDAEISRQGFFQGDCDDVTGYLAALLKSIGYAVEAVTISIPGRGHEFRHIFPRVRLRSGKWVTLEATARKKPMGWEAKSDRVKVYSL